MPSAKRKLKKGDIVSIDTGVQLDGYFGDSAITVPVGEVSEPVKKLLQVTQESLELAIDKVRAGNRLFDICGTVEKHVEENGFSVVREMVGHGIGTKLARRAAGSQLRGPAERESAAAGRHGAGDRADGERRAARTCRSSPDKWTAVTKDGSYSAHFEHCVAVTANGPWVLTRP